MSNIIDYFIWFCFIAILGLFALAISYGNQEIPCEEMQDYKRWQLPVRCENFDFNSLNQLQEEYE